MVANKFAGNFFTNAKGNYHVELRRDDVTQQQPILYEIDTFALDHASAMNMGLIVKYGYLTCCNSYLRSTGVEWGIILVVTHNETFETIYQDEQFHPSNFLSCLNSHL